MNINDGPFAQRLSLKFLLIQILKQNKIVENNRLIRLEYFFNALYFLYHICRVLHSKQFFIIEFIMYLIIESGFMFSNFILTIKK